LVWQKEYRERHKSETKRSEGVAELGKERRTGEAFLYPVSIARLFNQDYPLWNGAPNEESRSGSSTHQTGILFTIFGTVSYIRRMSIHTVTQDGMEAHFPMTHSLPVRALPEFKVDSNTIVVQRNAVQPTLVHTSCTFRYAPHMEENSLAGGTRMVHGNRLLNIERARLVSIVGPSKLSKG
jgi:hypothetical protein